MKKSIVFLMVLFASYYYSLGALPDKVYAPYVDVMLWPTFDIMSSYNATGQKYYTLAFIIAGTDGQPAWGGALGMSSDHMVDQISSLKAVGGDVIISFGGANGTPIASTITDVNALVSAYETVINKYGITWIDFDIEGWWVQDQASIDRRNQAAALLQSRNPNLRITYCLPVMPYGLTSDGVNIISKAKAAGVNIYGVNVMAMDYGQSNQAMGDAAISAAQNTRSQTGLNIGITPMIGKNDTQNETFTLANAQQVLSFATSTSWVNMIAMWSVNRDNGGCPGQTYASPTCSGLSQTDYAFVNIFKSFSGDNDCTPTTIQPYVSINGAAWQQTTSITVNVGDNLAFGPQPTDGTWNWTGPNGFSSTSREITISNIQKSQEGIYTANYTNQEGCISQASFNITVNETATDLVVSANGPYSGNTGIAINFTGTASGGTSPYTYSWNFGDGSTGSGSTITHTYNSEGTYTASLTITDASGSSASGSANVTINSGDEPSEECWTAWVSGVYLGGAQVSHNGINYTAKWWTNTEPGIDETWEANGACSGDGSTEPTEDCWPVWVSGVYLGSAQVSHNGINYMAKWWTNDEPGVDDTWEYKGPCVEGDDNSRLMNSTGDYAATNQTDEMAYYNQLLAKVSLQCYPNPVNSHSTLRYSLPDAGKVRISIYTLTGNEITVLKDGIVEAGAYNLSLDVSNIPDGFYTLLLKTEYASKSVKLIIKK